MSTSVCWGYGIHDSDSALDWEFLLRRVVGAPARAVLPDEHARQRVKFERGVPAMLALLDEEGANPANGEAYVAQGYQVMASLLMDAGCAFDESVRARLDAGISACPEFMTAKVLKGASGQPIDVLRVSHLFPDHGPLGPRGTADRLNGRLYAIETLLQNLREYDLTGSSPVQLMQLPPGMFATPTRL